MSDQTPSTSGSITNRFAIAEATKIELIGPGSLRMRRGDTSELELTCSQEDHERIEVKVSGDTLKVQFQGGFLRNRAPREQLDYAITLPILAELKIEGSLAGTAEGMEARDLKVELAGAAAIELIDLRAADLDVKLMGESHLTCTGAVTRLDLNLRERSVFEGAALACEICEIDANTGSSATVRPGRRLEVSATGESTVTAIAGNIELDLDFAAGCAFRQTPA